MTAEGKAYALMQRQTYRAACHYHRRRRHNRDAGTHREQRGQPEVFTLDGTPAPAVPPDAQIGQDVIPFARAISGRSVPIGARTARIEIAIKPPMMPTCSVAVWKAIVRNGSSVIRQKL